MHRSLKHTLFALLALCLAGAALAAPRGQAAATEPSTASAADSKPSGPQPKAVIPTPVADLPVVPKGETIKHDFVVKNEGQAPLQITSVRPACGCTIADYDKVIPPGGSGKIHTELDTSNMNAGGTAKTISVFTNDLANPRFELTLMVRIENYLVFNPGFARYTRGHGYEPLPISQLFYSPDFGDLAISKVESPWPFLKVEYREAKQEERRGEGKGKEYVFTTTLNYDDAPVGALNGTVLVHTNHPKQPIGRLPVSGFVRPRVAITPPVADFGDVDLSEPATARLLVNNFAPEKLRVTSVEQGLAGGSVSFSTAEEGKKYYVDFKLPADLPKGPFASEIKIHTDSPKNPVITVQVKGKVL